MSHGLPPNDLELPLKLYRTSLKKSAARRTSPRGGTLQQKSADSFGFGRFEQDLGQFHFLLQVVIRDLALGEELVQDIEIIPRIQRQESQFRQQR